MTVSPLFPEFLDFVRQIFSTEDSIPLHAPRFESNETKYVVEALKSTFVSSVGQHVNEFEGKIAEFT